MSGDPETASPDEDLHSIAKRMRDLRIHHLPVVEGEALVGFVSPLDLVGAIADHGLGDL